MAMLASKVPYPSSIGMGSSQTTSSSGQYSAGLSNHRTPAVGASHTASFASPTESEFSEALDGPDSVR